MAKRKIEVETDPATQNLVFSYDCVTDRVSYSIADISGTIHLKGKLKKSSPAKVNIDSLSKGLYVFCIIDGDELTQVKFKKN
jgi:uncharacterized alkaline shock family protein YloU